MNLHHAARKIVSGVSQDAVEGLPQLRTLLENGAQVNSIDEGMTALGIICSPHSDVISLRDTVKSALVLLVENGADPWIGEPATWRIHQMESPDGLLRARATLPDSMLHCDQDGNNDLHAIFSHEKHYLRRVSHDHFREHIHPKWLNDTNSKGETPLHLMWKDGVSDGNTIEALGIIWVCMKMGGRIDLSDHEGRMVAQMIAEDQELAFFADHPNDDEKFSIREALTDVCSVFARVSLNQATEKSAHLKPVRVGRL